jgi:hypothetical protein
MLFTVLAAFTLLSFAAGAFDSSAPFGLSWGPVDKVPRPSRETRENNVALLMYRDDRLPNNLDDTEEVVLEVCRKEGLQEVVWVSRLLSDDEERARYDTILAEGNRRYGQPVAGEKGTTYWSAGGLHVARVLEGSHLHRLIMASAGPELNNCSDEHASATGHSVPHHWMRFLPNAK